MLTFEEVDELVGGLPPSARKHTPWWGNAKGATGESRHWMRAGRLARPYMTSFVVSFGRAPMEGATPPKAPGRTTRQHAA